MTRAMFLAFCFVSAFMNMTAAAADAGPIQLGAYTFTKIADTRGPFASVSPVSSINANGVVSFFATRDDGSKGIFSGAGGLVTTIADNGGGFGVTDFDPESTINSAGVVAFDARLTNGSVGIFIGTGGSLAPIATGPFGTFVGLPAINDAGTVAFVFQSPQPAPVGVYTGNGGPLTTIGDTNGSTGVRIYENVLSISINQQGEVALSALQIAPGPPTGLYQGNGGPLIDLASSGLPFLDRVQGSSINDSGTVAFLGTRPGVGGTEDIYTVTQGFGAITNYTNGALSVFGNPSINDNGTVAFRAGSGSSEGIFIGPGPVFTQVIGEGDQLDGSTVGTGNATGDVYVSERGINNLGQITFFARLADGTEGIYRADPIPQAVVPEPGTGVLMGIGLAGIVRTLYRRRGRPR